MLYQPPFKPGAIPAVPGIFNDDADASYVNGDPSTGTEGSYFPNAAIEHPQREIIKALTSSGIIPDVAVLEQLAESQARYASGGVWANCSGAANTYTLAATGAFVVPKALFAGMMVETVVSATNDGASTADVFGLGSKKVLTYSGGALVGKELVAGLHSAWVYDITADGGAGAWLILPWAIAAADQLVNEQQLFIATGAGQGLGHNTEVEITTGYSVSLNTMRDSTFSTGRLTFGARDAGAYLVTCGLQITGAQTAKSLRISVGRNGGPQQSTKDMSGSDDTLAVSAVWTARFAAGQYISMLALQTNSASASRTCSLGYLNAVRIGN